MLSNRNKCIILLQTILILLSGARLLTSSEVIRIGIFTNDHIHTIHIQTPAHIILYDNNSIREQKLAEAEISFEQSKVIIKAEGKEFSVDSARFTLKNKNDVITCYINNKQYTPRSYEGAILIKNDKKILNILDLEAYIAGVVAKEAGSKKPYTFYEVQAIICRTYALKNINKHGYSGYNLCDQTHCQAYEGFTDNPLIKKAVKQTQNLVIIDSSGHLIDAVYHADCGGQTVSSKSVWNSRHNYLAPIKDEFCTMAPKKKWRIILSKLEWATLLKENFNYPIQDTAMLAKIYQFRQVERKTYFPDDTNMIHLTDIRSLLHLKSTFFSIFPDSDSSIVIEGKGHGHGVGLCQKGAIKMAEIKFSTQDIIKFYYHHVKIVPLKTNNLIFEPNLNENH